MIKKILNYIKNDIKNNYKSYIVLILIISTFFIKLDYNVYSPGGLINLNDRIETNNKYCCHRCYLTDENRPPRKKKIIRGKRDGTGWWESYPPGAP